MRTCSFVDAGVCVGLLARVQRPDGRYDADGALRGNGSVVHGLVGPEWPLEDHGRDSVAAHAGQQRHIVTPTQSLVRTHAILAVALRRR